MAKHPPIPGPAKRLVKLNRIFVFVLVPLGIFAAWALYAVLGEVRRPLLLLVAVFAFLVGSLASPLSRVSWAAYSVGYVAIVALGGLVFAVIAVAIVAAWFLYARKRFRVDGSTVRPVFSTEVAPGAAPFVDELVGAGWRQVGALGFDVGRHTVVASILVFQADDRYAEITDSVMSIVSRFPDDRRLVTRNSAIVPLPPRLLANDATGATPTELAAAHQRALDVLAAEGVQPEPLELEGLVESIVAEERQLTESIERAPTPWDAMRGGDAQAVDGSPESVERVRRWLLSASAGG